jgi:histidine triad (HIT) family protein
MAEGGALYQDDLVYAGHIHRLGHTDAYLGHLVVEPKRHVEGLAELTPEEAAALGRVVSELARALRSSEEAEQISSFVFGDGREPHLHVHVVPRYPGTPRDYRGLRVTEWPGAPRGGADEIVALCDRLRASISLTS